MKQLTMYMHTAALLISIITNYTVSGKSNSFLTKQVVSKKRTNNKLNFVLKLLMIEISRKATSQINT